MLRIVFIILAIVTITLAFVLGQAVLYLVAAALLAGAALLMTRKLKKEHNDIPESFMTAPMPPEVDLSSLGIIDIRPKTDRLSISAGEADGSRRRNPGAARPATPDLFSGRFVDRSSDVYDMTGNKSSGTDDDAEVTGTPKVIFDDSPAGPRSAEPVFSLSTEGNVDSATAVSRVRARESSGKILVSGVSSRQKREVLIPALTSLRASLDAYTVCLLHQSERPVKYHIEAIVSPNSYARSQGSFMAAEPLLSGQRSSVAAVFSQLGDDGFSSQKLGYYHEPISVRQVAVVPVSSGLVADEFLLVVDTMNAGSLESSQARLVLEQYARLFGTVLKGSSEPSDERTSTSNESRPRREIIQEEMERARTHSLPLALALVFLNSGEKMVGVDTEEIDITESAFELRLRAVANDGMVEHFGELTYGVFYSGPEGSVAQWAAHIQASFAGEDGLLEGGVSVGVASLQERHVSPDDLRADATAALKQAFDSGECTIVE